MLILDKPLALERMLTRACRARIPAVFALPPPNARSADATPVAASPLPIGAWLWGDYPMPSLAPAREPVGAR